MTVTCNCSGKDTLESYTKQVNTAKNEKEVFEENVIIEQIQNRNQANTYLKIFIFYLPIYLEKM